MNKYLVIDYDDHDHVSLESKGKVIRYLKDNYGDIETVEGCLDNESLMIFTVEKDSIVALSPKIKKEIVL